MEDAPTIEVTFANGLKDQMELTHHRIYKDSVVGCNYIGNLRNSSTSSLAVTGSLNKPGDRMEITMISDNNINKMFTVDYNGKTKIIKNPFEEGGLRNLLYFN